MKNKFKSLITPFVLVSLVLLLVLNVFLLSQVSKLQSSLDAQGDKVFKLSEENQNNLEAIDEVCSKVEALQDNAGLISYVGSCSHY